MEQKITLTVIDGDMQHKILLTKTAILKDVLMEHGFSPYTRYTQRLNCGGNGICATCGVRVLDNSLPPTHWHDKLAHRYGYPRLSCQILVTQDMTIAIVKDKKIWGGPIKKEENGLSL